jgi:hypothetical protein
MSVVDRVTAPVLPATLCTGTPVVVPVPPLLTAKIPLTPEAGTLVAAMVPVPLAAMLAPVPTTMAALEFVLPVSALNAVAPVADAVIVWFGQAPETVTLEPATNDGVGVPVPPLATLSGSVAVAALVSPRFVRAVDALARSERLFAGARHGAATICEEAFEPTQGWDAGTAVPFTVAALRTPVICEAAMLLFVNVCVPVKVTTFAGAMPLSAPLPDPLPAIRLVTAGMVAPPPVPQVPATIWLFVFVPKQD